MSTRTILVVGATSAMAAQTIETLEEEAAEVLRWSRKNTPGGSVIADLLKDELPAVPDKLDGLAYFPGTVRLGAFNRITLEQFREDWDINVGGFIRVVQHVLPALQKAGSASVVGVSTVAVRTGLSFHASIAQSKGGLEALIRALAAEYAPKGIRFNSVAPSLTESPATEPLLNTDDKRQRMNKRHPLGRIGRPEDIAEAVAYLLSERSSWVTGEALSVDGGYGAIRQ